MVIKIYYLYNKYEGTKILEKTKTIPLFIRLQMFLLQKI